MTQTEQHDKTQLLEKMNTGFAAFEALLAPLTEEQLTTPTVNGTWSIKDNLAHLSQWHKRVVNLLNAIQQGVSLPDPTPGMGEAEINEMFYQQNKDKSLQDVQVEFRSTFQQLVDGVKAANDEELVKRRAWLNRRSAWDYVPGNTYEHYEEHAEIIEAWLAKEQL